VSQESVEAMQWATEAYNQADLDGFFAYGLDTDWPRPSLGACRQVKRRLCLLSPEVHRVALSCSSVRNQAAARNASQSAWRANFMMNQKASRQVREAVSARRTVPTT
jgi:hypothetical protein